MQFRAIEIQLTSNKIQKLTVSKGYRATDQTKERTSLDCYGIDLFKGRSVNK